MGILMGTRLSHWWKRHDRNRDLPRGVVGVRIVVMTVDAVVSIVILIFGVETVRPTECATSAGWDGPVVTIEFPATQTTAQSAESASSQERQTNRSRAATSAARSLVQPSEYAQHRKKTNLTLQTPHHLHPHRPRLHQRISQ